MGSDSILDRTSRKLLAAVWKAKIGSLNDSVPSLSPSQLEWIEEELSDQQLNQNTNRWLAASETKEAYINAAKPALATNYYLISMLADQGLDLTVQQEANLWVSLAINLMEPTVNDALINLVELGMIDYNDIGLDGSFSVDVKNARLGRRIDGLRILRWIVQPILENE